MFKSLMYMERVWIKYIKEIKEMKKIIILTMVLIIGAFFGLSNDNNLKARDNVGSTVFECSLYISRGSGCADCDTTVECWRQIAEELIGEGNVSCGTVACAVCDTARFLAPKILKKYTIRNVSTCSRAIAEYLKTEHGSWATTVCNIARKVGETGALWQEEFD